jgi:hypothetical protein
MAKNNKSNNVIYVYTDSTGFPRGNLVPAHETWPMYLRKYADNLYVRGRGGITIRETLQNIKNDSFYFAFREKSAHKILIILAFGIVDCAPQPITYKLSKLAYIPFIGRYVWRALSKLIKPHRPIIQKFWSYQNTSIKQFKKTLIKILVSISNPNCQIIILSTPLPSKLVLSRSPGFETAIDKYNNIKKVVSKLYPRVTYLELLINRDKAYISEKDGHHFSGTGHQEIAQQVLKHIQNSRLLKG